MADQDRTPPHPVAALERLARAPYEFDFFSALRRLEAFHRDKPRFGESARAADDPVRLGQDPSLSFAPATLAGFTPGADGRPARLVSQHFGLFGPNGALPAHLTEYARDRQRNFDDPTFARFADLFHHRMMALFYRAWANAEPTASFDRPEADRFGTYVGSLFGLGMPSLRRRDAMPDLAKLYFAGRLAAQTRNAEGLGAILQDFFRMPVAIREFVGAWMELPPELVCRLGRDRDTGLLGRNAVLGRRVWGYQHKFSIVFGPVGLADYERLLPGGDSLARLIPIVRNYVGDELAWDVRLILEREEVPPLALGRGGRLGWTSWLTPRRDPRDADDLSLNPMKARPAAGGRANLQRGPHP